MSTREPQYYDCFATVGRYAGRDPEAPWRVEALLEEMERCRIQGALVYARQAAEIHPQVGNPLVSRICADHPRLWPCWVVLPHHSDEFPSPEKLLVQMEQHQVRAVKIFPRTFRFQVDFFTLGELLLHLQEAGILLIVDRGEFNQTVQIEWHELEWLCKNFPRLPILLHNLRWEATRTVLPLIRRFENLHVEFSSYQGNRMLELWCRQIGSERLLFGTRALEKSMGAAKAYLDYADLSDSEHAAIAGENLRRLLRLAEVPPPYPAREPDDQILNQALRRLAIKPIPMIDAHAHINPEGVRGAATAVMNRSDAPAVVERNRRIGVKKTCVSSWIAIWGDYQLGNQDTIAAVQKYPDEIIGLAVLDPNYIKDWDSELEYYHLRHRLPGMKPYYPKMGIPYTDRRFDPWWEFGNAHSLFALLHPSDNFSNEVRVLAERFPNISFLLAHSGWSWKTVRNHVELARRYPNVYLELTFTSVLHGSIEFMVRELGSSKIVYGSDAPMRDPFPQFGWVAYSNIREAEKKDIFGRNMARILAKVRL